MMINVTELKRKVIDEFLISQPLVTNTPFKSVAKIYTDESTNAEEKNKYSVKTNDCYPYVSTKDISIKGSVNFENGMYIPKGEKKFSIAPVNSILLCIEGGNAGNKIAIIKEATCFVNKLCCFDIFGADNRFIYYYLLSNQFRNNFKEQMTGLIGGVSVKKLKELILPLPHITEQKRIADKLDEIFAELDKIDEKQIRLATIQEKMEAKILKLAIQGKLVEQRSEDGTGEELFKHIQLEKQELIKQGKIKKEKPLPAIEEDEVPFEIPSTWKWVRLGDISNYNQRKSKISYKDISLSTWSLDLEDIEKDTARIIQKRYAKDREIKGDRYIFNKGQILFGKLRPYLKKYLIAPGEGVCSMELIPFDAYGCISNEYVLYVIRSNYIFTAIDKVCHGVTLPRVSSDFVCNLAFPLPPVEEQKRIVAKLEELLPLCRGN